MAFCYSPIANIHVNSCQEFVGMYQLLNTCHQCILMSISKYQSLRSSKRCHVHGNVHILLMWLSLLTCQASACSCQRLNYFLVNSRRGSLLLVACLLCIELYCNTGATESLCSLFFYSKKQISWKLILFSLKKIYTKYLSNKDAIFFVDKNSFNFFQKCVNKICGKNLGINKRYYKIMTS